MHTKEENTFGFADIRTWSEGRWRVFEDALSVGDVGAVQQQWDEYRAGILAGEEIEVFHEMLLHTTKALAVVWPGCLGALLGKYPECIDMPGVAEKMNSWNADAETEYDVYLDFYDCGPNDATVHPWALALAHQPQLRSYCKRFADFCAWTWIWLLGEQPEFESFCPLKEILSNPIKAFGSEALAEECWNELIARRPQFAKYSLVLHK